MNKYLFVRIPKTASSSICQALRESIPHKTANQWSKELPDFSERFKFSVVRNPYARFRSMCRFFKFKPEEFKAKNNYLSQVDFLYRGNNLLVDYVGRFEDLDNSWRHICKMINKPYGPLRYKKVQKEPLPPVEEVVDIVQRYFKRDFEMFNYPIDSYKNL